jgi:hypothetical protein
MQEESLKEYEQIRSEMLNLKDCVTKYMGYVIQGRCRLAGISLSRAARIRLWGKKYIRAAGLQTWEADLASYVFTEKQTGCEFSVDAR